jgi:hypothetical protein
MVLPNPGLTSANAVELASATVNQLPAASRFPGALAFIADYGGTGTLSTAIVGGGTQAVLAFSNGTTWNVAAT